jgi:hypothetical protein
MLHSRIDYPKDDDRSSASAKRLSNGGDSGHSHGNSKGNSNGNGGGNALQTAKRA